MRSVNADRADSTVFGRPKLPTVQGFRGASGESCLVGRAMQRVPIAKNDLSLVGRAKQLVHDAIDVPYLVGRNI